MLNLYLVCKQLKNLIVTYHLRHSKPTVSMTTPTSIATAMMIAIDMPCDDVTVPQTLSPPSLPSPAR